MTPWLWNTVSLWACLVLGWGGKLRFYLQLLLQSPGSYSNSVTLCLSWRIWWVLREREKDRSLGKRKPVEGVWQPRQFSLEVVAAVSGAYCPKSGQSATIWALLSLSESMMWDSSCGCLGQLFPLVKDLWVGVTKVQVAWELCWYFPNGALCKKVPGVSWMPGSGSVWQNLFLHCQSGGVGPRHWDRQLCEVSAFFTSNYFSPEKQSPKDWSVQAKTNKRQEKEKKVLFSKLHLPWVSGSENWQNDLIIRQIIKKKIFKGKKPTEKKIKWFGKPIMAVLFI